MVLTRDAGAIITSVEDGIVELLGWSPDQLVGRPSTTLIHPEDQPSAIAAWMEMLTAPGSTRLWRGRYRSAGGAWKWVETLNENHLNEPGEYVRSIMTRVTGDQVGVEEELRARTQLLSRLADALPVGLVQIDANYSITFANDQLYRIVGSPPAATIAAVLAGIAVDDKPLLDEALTAVLAEQPVDDIEIRLEAPVNKVCLLSLRALTDSDGNVTGAIGCVSDITDRANLRHELEIRASIDTLTSCLNRAATIEHLSTVLEGQHRNGSGTAVVFIDLDGFKSVNDLHGHAAVIVSSSSRRNASAPPYAAVT